MSEVASPSQAAGVVASSEGHAMVTHNTGVGSSSVIAELVRMLASKDQEIATLRQQLEQARQQLLLATEVATAPAYARASSPTSSSTPARAYSLTTTPPRGRVGSSPRRAVVMGGASSPYGAEIAVPEQEELLSIARSVSAARRRTADHLRRNTGGVEGLKVGVPGPEYILDSGYFRPQSSKALRFVEGGRGHFTAVPNRTPHSKEAALMAKLSPRDQVRLQGFVTPPETPGPSSYSPLHSKKGPAAAVPPRGASPRPGTRTPPRTSTL